jgi:hypothetical protein
MDPNYCWGSWYCDGENIRGRYIGIFLLLADLLKVDKSIGTTLKLLL